MDKLKTLKDFEFRLFTNESTNKFANKNIRNNLKAEAIKWVKDKERGIKFHQEDLSVSGNEAHKVIDFLHAQIEWIKHFFNITEKDL